MMTGPNVAAMPRASIRVVESLSPRLDQRAARVMARRRLEAELRAIALDVLGTRGADELPAELAAWLDDATRRVVTAICDDSLAALIQGLELSVAAAPGDLVRRLNEAASRHDAGVF